MRILAIESSADESGVSLIEASGDFASDFSYTVLGNAVASQIATHTQYGGIFPSMAVREHQKNFVPLLETVLKEADMLIEGDTSVDIESILSRETELREQLTAFLTRYSKPAIEAIAVTYGPGLEPTLWVGINFAKALAQVWNLPLIPVNHMEGHIVMAMTRHDEASADEGRGVSESIAKTKYLEPITFPLLSLLISGGHTELVLSKEWMQYELLGQTRDDAVGEAFDKVARLLGLPYPGGPEISRLAVAARISGFTKSRYTLPRPMIDSGDYDFSFSGIKTAVKRLVEANEPLTEDIKKHIALEFEEAAVEVLIAKTMRAIEEFGAETVLVGGGVSANTHIRESLAQAIKDYGYSTRLLIPPPALATDNALMIALAGYFRALKKEYADFDSVHAQGNLKLTKKTPTP